jgi:hypothetical protein
VYFFLNLLVDGHSNGMEVIILAESLGQLVNDDCEVMGLNGFQIILPGELFLHVLQQSDE